MEVNKRSQRTLSGIGISHFDSRLFKRNLDWCYISPIPLSPVTKVVLCVYGENIPTSKIMENDALFTNIQENMKHRVHFVATISYSIQNVHLLQHRDEAYKEINFQTPSEVGERKWTQMHRVSTLQARQMLQDCSGKQYPSKSATKSSRRG
ncbi:hypothetical protein AVEN_45066-1 [Araneus ventricosus]|uniref:Uncharacterized protein n=1 Tax=Araneus ventricosus TaxID=182803 RepID=A0A4Y2RN86_ARAVE|nr:hypothetical protein AVEN_45066-1 [Araneus ventricosus]